MVAETREHSVDIRGVTATLVDVVVAGHIVELVLSYDVEEAEAVHGTPFNDGVDEIMHMEVTALGNTFDDGPLQAVASAASYVLNGKYVRRAKIGHCGDIEPSDNNSRRTVNIHVDLYSRKPHGLRPIILLDWESVDSFSRF